MSDWLTSVADALGRMFAPRSDSVGAGSAGGSPVTPDYSPAAAMASASKFPWIWVCIRARIDDQASLPKRAVRRSGSLEKILDDHPVLELWRYPSPRYSGLRLDRQLHFDFGLSGNAYIHRPAPNLLHRMHPHLTEILVDEYSGREVAWGYGGGLKKRRIPLDQVYHIADVSWSIGLSMLLGETPLRALHDDLSTMLKAQKMAQRQAGRGRPELLISPMDKETAVNPSAIEKMEQAWERFTSKGRGAFFVGAGMKATPLNITPRDLEYGELRADLRDMTLAVFQVPPARAGLATANYGTQKQQMRTYWEGLIRGELALFDDARSMMIPARDTFVESDTSRVEALQQGYTERLLRVERLVNLGASPKEAMAWEGWPNAPVGNSMGGRMRPPSTKVGEPQEKRAAPPTVVEVLHRALQESAERYQTRVLQADGDVDAACSSRERDFEALHLVGTLERAGVPEGLALQHAHEIATVSNEAVRLVATEAAERGVMRIGLPALAAFGEGRAHELAGGLELDIQDHRSVA